MFKNLWGYHKIILLKLASYLCSLISVLQGSGSNLRFLQILRFKTKPFHDS